MQNAYASIYKYMFQIYCIYYVMSIWINYCFCTYIIFMVSDLHNLVFMYFLLYYLYIYYTYYLHPVPICLSALFLMML